MRNSYSHLQGESGALMDLMQVKRMIRASIFSHKALILGVTLCAVLAGLLYILLKPKSYTASTRILIENRIVSSANSNGFVIQSKTDDTLVRTQVEILRSDKIARWVINKKRLLAQSDFGGAGSGGAAVARARNTSENSADGGGSSVAGVPHYAGGESEAMLKALKLFAARLTVSSAKLASVIDIHFTASNPRLAASIANTVIDGYLNDQKEANEAVARSASGVMRQRLQSLGVKARVLSKAKPPLAADGLRKSFLLALAGMGGLMLGLVVAFTRDLLDTKLKTPGAVATVTKKRCFGFIPANIPEHRPFRRWFVYNNSVREKEDNKQLTANSMLDWAVERPRSTTAHTLRRAAVALLSSEPAPRVIGVTSAMPHEGKTVTSVNFARVVAQFNKRVLLVDAEYYTAANTKLLFPKARLGIENAFLGTPLDQIVIPDHLTDMDFLPSVRDSFATDRDGKLFSQSLERTLELAKQDYDVIIIDLPPFVPVSDVHEMQHMVDNFLLVVQWGVHSAESLSKALSISDAIQKKVVGTVLTKANATVIKEYCDDVDGMYVSECVNYVDNEHVPLKGRGSKAS